MFSGNGGESGYAVQFIQHAKQVQSEINLSIQGSECNNDHQESGYALKTGSGTRTVFTLEQKEIMIAVYELQAASGVRANANNVIEMMTERGIPLLTERQIKSWWSSYHQKKKKKMQELANRASLLAGNNPSMTPSPSPADTSQHSTDTGTSTQQQPMHNPDSNLTRPTLIPPCPVPSDLPDPLRTYVSDASSSTIPPAPPAVSPQLGNHAAITQWTYPRNFSQSTLYERDGSNACTIIALYFGHLHHKHSPPLPVSTYNMQDWTRYLETAICFGNNLHDELFDMNAINLSCEEAIALAGEDCYVDTVGGTLSCLGDDCSQQLSRLFEQAAEQANRKIAFTF